MPRFVHADPSLTRVGGHEYDCALSLLRSAEEGGYTVALATNRRYRDRSSLPDGWPVYPFFPYTSRTRYCIARGGHDHLPIGFDGRPLSPEGTVARPRLLRQPLTAARGAIGKLLRWQGGRRRIRALTQSLARLSAALEWAEGDHVFLATFTEFDLLGLAKYLLDHPQSRNAVWHVQFHCDLYEGCGPDAPRHDERLSVARRQFQYSLAHLPHHRIRLYTTTAELAAQYNQLGVASFRHLPYPVNPALQRRCELRSGRLHITCAGGIRREKGAHHLGYLVKILRHDTFFDGKLEFCVQVRKEKLHRLGIPQQTGQGEKANIPVRGLPYPLTIDSYHNLIRRTDIGLFLYDNRRYHLRCSGILLEMLTAGKPVIVPAGCWLAEQIAEPIFAHVETQRRSLPLVRRLRTDDMDWIELDGRRTSLVATTRPLASTPSPEITTVIPVPPSATEFVVAFRRPGAAESCAYLSVETEQFDRRGELVDRFESVVGHRRGNRPIPILAHLDPRAVRIGVRLKNAYRPGELAVTDVEADFLQARRPGGCPLGSVGLIASRFTDVPRLLREMVEHYTHYRSSAEEFSRSRLASHHPARTVDLLTSDGRAAA